MMSGFVRSLVARLPLRPSVRSGSLDTEHKQIFRGLFVVASFVFLAKLAAMFKEMAIAWRYGISETVDAYLFVFNLVQWPLGIVGSVIGAVLVPFATRLNHETPLDVPRFRSELLGASILLASGLGMFAWWILPWMVQQPWIGLEQSQVILAREMASSLVWVLPPGILVQLWASWTMVGNRHLNTLLEGVPALAILLAVLVATGSQPLIWGTLFGVILQALLLYFSLVHRGEAEVPCFFFKSTHWQPFITGIGIMSVGVVLMSIVNLSDQFFAAHLGPGVLSTLGYSNRILSLVLGLGVVAIGRASLPVLSRAHVDGSGKMARLAFQWSAILFGAGLLVMVVGLWGAPYVVEILFQRGQFTLTDTIRVAEVLRYAIIQVPFYFASTILVYALLSQRRHTMMVLIGGASLATKLMLAIVLVPVLGLKGLMLATAGVYFVSSALALHALGARDS